jgi:uncharacterized protein YndB with AHSA1/START domain
MSSVFHYVIYIQTTPEKLWQALTKPEFTRQYWGGVAAESDWRPGSPWQLTLPDGRVADKGEIVEADAPRRLVIRWQHQLDAALTAEGPTLCTFDIEPAQGSVKLTIRHECERDNAKIIQGLSFGWPMILSALKTLLETGKSLGPG